MKKKKKQKHWENVACEHLCSREAMFCLPDVVGGRGSCVVTCGRGASVLTGGGGAWVVTDGGGA